MDPRRFPGQAGGRGLPHLGLCAGETKGFHTWRNDRAVKAGLRFRPAADTVKDTMAWFKTQKKIEKGRNKLAGPSPEAETKLIAAWREASQPKG